MPGKDDSKDDLKSVWIYTLIGVLLALLLVGASAYLTSHPIWADITRELGVAAIVAIMLMWTFERISTTANARAVEKFNRAVGDNLIQAVYGNAIPPALWRTIRETLLAERFIRTNYEIRVTLRDFLAAVAKKTLAVRDADMRNTQWRKEASDLELFHFTTTYHVKNVSPVKATYNLVFELSTKPEDKFGLYSSITQVFVQGINQLPSPLNGPPAPKDDPSYLKFSKDIEVPADGTITVAISSWERKRKDDRHIWQTLKPCSGLSVQVEDEDKLLDYCISLDAQNLSGGERFVQGGPGVTSVRLETEEHLLPYQGVTVSWHSSVSTGLAATGGASPN